MRSNYLRRRVRRGRSACARAGSASSAATTTRLDVVGRFATALRPGGRLALSAFSSYFVVRHLEPDEHFDADRGVNHERAVVRDADRE